jgi:hypothetical protein
MHEQISKFSYGRDIAVTLALKMQKNSIKMSLLTFQMPQKLPSPVRVKVNQKLRNQYEIIKLS